MNLRFATDDEIADWDNLILNNPDGGNVFQSYEMTNFKRLSDWRPRFIVFESSVNTYISVQEKKVPLLGKVWYLAKGPGLIETSQLEEFLDKVKLLAKKCGAFLVKIEPEFLRTPENLESFNSFGLRSVKPIQPNYSTILLNIADTEDDILSAMPRKGAKYSINRAKREGVEVKRVLSSDENCQIFYDLLSLTADGSGFNIRKFDYHKEFWQTFSKANIGQLFFAYYEGEVVAAAYGFVFGEKSTYKDGASVRERKVYGASHLLQWELILWARERGAKVHDLCGTPPSNQIHNKKHFLYGVGHFKTSFSKNITDYVGAFDLSINKTKYNIWQRIGERICMKISRKFKNQNWY